MRTLLWFRDKDLRLADHPALHEALARGPVLPLYVLEPATTADGARPHHQQFLLDALADLEQSIARRGSRLLVARGDPARVVPELARRWAVDRVAAQRRAEPEASAQDARVARALGVPFDLHPGETLLPAGTLRNGAGAPHSVFSWFARDFHLRAAVAAPLPAPRALPPLPPDLRAPTDGLPRAEDPGLPRNPLVQPGGERAARARLRAFLAGAAGDYRRGRDRMDRPGTSRLSADLKFGTLSPRAVWHAITRALGDSPDARTFTGELIWREFAYSTLHDRPALLTEPFQPAWAAFPWIDQPDAWTAWVEGTTGYPVVDAAARQLLGEGFVHNRARMVSASFLSKHLLIDYRRGEAHYLRLLTDGDPAQNNLNWQWCAGCGCDAQPYFRVFNPVRQGQRFDPDGDYVRRWVPELARLPARYVHHPWTAPPDVLDSAGVKLGASYPRPIVDHTFARARFLALASETLREPARPAARRPHAAALQPTSRPR
jgi:deoxyribodipyrimidine photo-lyase